MRARPSPRVWGAIAGVVAMTGIGSLVTCGGCKKRPPAEQASGASSSLVEPRETDVTRALDASPMWASAKEGDPEDRIILAIEEGALGLVEGARVPELRETAIRSMAYARGWAQLPFLARVAVGSNDEEARLALESLVEIASRSRRAEAPEDADELREGCERLLALARDASRPRPRRVLAVRSLRMLPCPRRDQDGGDATPPSDVDSR